MRLASFYVGVATTTVVVIRTIAALPASPIALTSESYSLGDQLPALNTSFPANLTDSNAIFVAECGDQTLNVQHAYNVARAAVILAKADVFRGAHSPFGFSAMFKNDNSKYPVSDLLNMIRYLQGLRDLKPDMAHLTSPRLACVQRNSATVFQGLQLGYDPWQRCDGRRRSRRAPSQAFYAFGTAYIFLCPNFHDQAPAPAGSHCPTVMENQFVGDVNIFYRDYQMYTVLYGLIRFYLQQDALHSRSFPKEVFDWNQCVGCSSRSSTRNPTNFLLYIALAQQQCLASPNPFAPPFTPSGAADSINHSLGRHDVADEDA